MFALEMRDAFGSVSHVQMEQLESNGNSLMIVDDILSRIMKLVSK
jgi:hypothetical protein